MSRVVWSGRVISAQPRIHLERSFDQVMHEYRGYVITIDGRVDGEPREVAIAIGIAAQARHQFRVGDLVSGAGHLIEPAPVETVELHKASALRVLEPGRLPATPPPWHDAPPALSVYRERGHRRLDRRVYDRTCRSCVWGCLMPVVMILDHWKPEVRKYRTETFCYGPLSCRLYAAGPTRKVPGRRGLVYEEEDWVDRDATSHRAPDE
jgi:hypothetical protein